MKKIICLTLAALMLLTLASCSKKAETETTTDAVSENETATESEITEGSVQVVNPLQDVTAEEAASELGLKALTVPEGCTVGDITKINGSDELFRFTVTSDGTEYQVSIVKSEETEIGDISGIYLSDDAVCAIYDSADISVQPSYSVEYDSEYIKAYCTWNGFSFALSTEISDINTDDFAVFSVSLVKALFGSDNLA